jgi:rhodanese-related sulfurtransferase
VALQLMDLGVKDAKALKGGYGAWVVAGGATATGDTEK